MANYGSLRLRITFYTKPLLGPGFVSRYHRGSLRLFLHTRQESTAADAHPVQSGSGEQKDLGCHPLRGVLYRSTNNGGNWARVTNGIPGRVTALVFTIAGTKLVAATISGFYVSADNGTTWRGC